MKQELVAYLIRDNEQVSDMPTDGLLVALDQLMQASTTQGARPILRHCSRLRVFTNAEAGHAHIQGRLSREIFVE